MCHLGHLSSHVTNIVLGQTFERIAGRLAGLSFGLIQEGMAARTGLEHHKSNMRALEIAGTVDPYAARHMQRTVPMLAEVDADVRNLGNFLDRMEEILPAVPEAGTALLHGDLWGGNAGFLEDGTPVIYDPASYYGDPETDLAMTELFGSFGRAFFDAYHEVSPIDPGYPERRDLYNLYHVLNHFNLFGGGYGEQAGDMIRRLLAEAGYLC